MTDIEGINNSKLYMLVKDLVNNINNINNKNDCEYIFNILKTKYKICPSKNEIRNILLSNYDDNIHKKLVGYFIKKSVRSNSGVLVITVVLRPDIFSCSHKCSYCPTESDLHGNPTQPKSYLSTEPAMLRALKYNFDIKDQIIDRIKCYITTGNLILDNNKSHKLEVIVSGGTWENYNYNYRELVMKEIYYTANTFINTRQIKNLEEEIIINETSEFRIIGLTIETRPDYITKKSIKDYRRWGITRVQLGIQHYNDSILNKINRGCFTNHTIKAIKMLKQCGFKIVCHLMPDLPGSSPQLDKWMFEQSIHNENLQFDDIKIYPTAICKSSNPNLIVKSDIYDWYEKGDYIPYAEKNINDLIDVLIYYKSNIQPWIRIQRLIRDIPSQSILAGYEKNSNLRQHIQNKMDKLKLRCNCIRCKEIKDEIINGEPYLVVNKYIASNGTEFFISLQHHNFSIFNYIYYKFIC